MKICRVEQFDFTMPEAETMEYEEITGGLAIIGAPVYAGRIPLEAVRRFQMLRANDVPVVLVVLYGNREYDDALLELKDLAEGLGFKPVAGGAFIGEHSYSNEDMPIAKGRPDAADVKQAQEFGEKIIDLLSAIDSLSNLSPLQLPGNFPYIERRPTSGITPVTDETLCNKCEICVTVCPTNSITVNDTVQSDHDTCIWCCACVKYCPLQARHLNDSVINQKRERLYLDCSERKEPELYISSEV
ncbi:4Fe-4S binding protein [Chloroflexota bacterium]